MSEHLLAKMVVAVSTIVLSTVDGAHVTWKRIVCICCKISWVFLGIFHWNILECFGKLSGNSELHSTAATTGVLQLTPHSL